jgi:enoyl-CoA hydratase/carnithine racemase
MDSAGTPGSDDRPGPAAAREDSGGRLTVRILDGVARVEITNPGRRNAMTERMWRSIPPLFARLRDDPEVLVVIMTGHGGTFSAGADITELHRIRATGPDADPGQESLPESRPQDVEDIVVAAEQAIISLPQPTIAVIDGYCIGGGCQIACACDLRLASDRSRFGITPAKLGLVYPASSLQRLTALIGPSAAKLLLFTADLIDVDHALRIGLVDERHPGADLPARVIELAATMASRSRLTLHAAKDIIDRAAAGRPLAERDRYWAGAATACGEASEGVAAFLERRPARFPWEPGPVTHVG